MSEGDLTFDAAVFQPEQCKQVKEETQITDVTDPQLQQKASSVRVERGQQKN